MASCCDARGCDAMFGRRFARRVARRYRKRGLDKTAARIVRFLQTAGIEGATVLEIGGGVGEIQVELLERGARRTVNLELSPAYEDEARALLAERRLAERVERRLLDIAQAPDGVPRADAVVLHRVVCCYPDYERLLGAAADRAGRLLVFSYPRHNPVSRLLVAAENLAFRIARKEFRTFAHPPQAMLAVLRAHGLEPAYDERRLVWQVSGLSR
jgi:cyclopropane fatty-acyl-phospholipid synthase-like methyltransferase